MRKATRPDAGEQEIGDWHRWFINGHRQRLRADGHDAATVEDLMVTITTLAAAIAERLRSDHHTRQP